MSAGPTYHSIMGRGFDSEGVEVLVSGVWSRATEADEWVSNGVLTEPIHPTGLTSILRDSPAAGNRPATMDLVWRNESFQTACYIVEYDAADGTRKETELCAHIGGTALPEAADDPNVSIRPVPRRAWQTGVLSPGLDAVVIDELVRFRFDRITDSTITLEHR